LNNLKKNSITQIRRKL